MAPPESQLRQPEDRGDDRRGYLADAGEGGGDSQLPPDQQIHWRDRAELESAVARVFSSPNTARQILRAIGFPAEYQAWDQTNAQTLWSEIFEEFDNGVLPDPYRRLIEVAHRRYSSNRTFARLYGDYGPEVPPAASNICHVVVRASSEEERAEARAVLADLSLQPDPHWETEHAASFAVTATDPEALARMLGRSGLGFTVVPPGVNDYLLRELIVQGPDGQRFRLVDAPAQQTISNVVSEVVGARYDPGGVGETTRPTVVDRVDASGDTTRVQGDMTLDEAGFQDGDNMRIGFEGRAGAGDSIAWQNAIDRVFKQIRGFCESHGALPLRVDSVNLPTIFEIDFEQRSFAPSEAYGGLPPSEITRHTVRISLPPDFPTIAPMVVWLTPIFHPNIYPMYECPKAEEHPEAGGLVCLGMLAESWQPGIDFAEVVQTLIDIAGYRNYELYYPALNLATRERLANHYDPIAADWAETHQAEIVAIGGTAIDQRPFATTTGYPNVIVAVD